MCVPAHSRARTHTPLEFSLRLSGPLDNVLVRFIQKLTYTCVLFDFYFMCNGYLAYMCVCASIPGNACFPGMSEEAIRSLDLELWMAIATTDARNSQVLSARTGQP